MQKDTNPTTTTTTNPPRRVILRLPKLLVQARNIVPVATATTPPAQILQTVREQISSSTTPSTTPSTTTTAPNGYVDHDWLYFQRFWPLATNNQETTFQRLERELAPYLTIGEVKVFGTHQERRQTTYFSLTETPMDYSGRVLQPVHPPNGSFVAEAFEAINNPALRTLLQENYPSLEQIPIFNSVFINKYRRPEETESQGVKRDCLGWHADDERSLASDIILSLTFCQKNGERIFELRPKAAKSGCTRQIELANGSAFFMLGGCQKRWKHRVADRATKLNGTRVTGARFNLTFRVL